MIGYWLAGVGLITADPQPAHEETETIIVTGERVSRSLRETSSSVFVATESDLRDHGADRLEQVLALIPNVQLGNGSEGPSIRGQDTTGALQALPAFLGGNRPRTAVIVDGRRATYNEFIFGAAPVWDVSRIEVFRSPQTTTQGQNSIAGALFVVSNDPTFEPEAGARAIAGNFKTRQLSAMASGPLVGDEVAFRVAGDVRYSRTTSRIADRAVGADPNHDVYGQVRAKLLVKPAFLPNAQVVLTYSHLESQAPQVVPVTAPFRDRRDESGFFGTFRINVDSTTAAIRNETGALTTNLLFTTGNSRAQRLAFPGLGQSRIEGRDWSTEAVINWAPEGPLRAVAGIAHTHVGLRQFIDLSAIGATGRFRDSQDSTGIFGEASLTLLSKATLTAGIRYQQDRQNRTGDLTTDLTGVPLDYDRTFRAWLPKLSLAYDFSPAVRAGMMVQRAYNPGGTTLRFDIGQPDNFEAETLWDFELFARPRLGRNVTASANLFYYDMHDAQRAKEILLTGPAGFPLGFADIFNVPKAKSYGLEGELQWRQSSRLSARLAVGLLDTRIVRSAVGYGEFDGDQFGRSPHLSAAAAVVWEPAPRVQLSTQARHHSSYFSDDQNGALTKVDQATIVDLRVEYRMSRLILFADAHNFFDKFALVARDNFTATLEDPRKVAVGIETRF